VVDSSDWTSDAFYTFVVPVDPNELDEPDYNQPFYGLSTKRIPASMI
jgi:hypothetical protein